MDVMLLIVGHQVTPTICLQACILKNKNINVIIFSHQQELWICANGFVQRYWRYMYVLLRYRSMNSIDMCYILLVPLWCFRVLFFFALFILEWINSEFLKLQSGILSSLLLHFLYRCIVTSPQNPLFCMT